MISGKNAVYLTMVGVLLCFLLIAYMGTAGCLRTAAGSAWQVINPPEPVPEVSIIPIPAETPVVEVSQPVVYTESEELRMYRTGGKWLGQNFTWIRYDVSGLKDMKVRAMVYDYKVLYSYRWWSVSWGRYFAQFPDAGKKYLIVQVYMEMVGDDQRWDPRMYGMGADHFYVQADGVIIGNDTTYVPCTRIRELEETWNYNHVEAVEFYGYKRVQEAGSGKITCEDLGYLRMGKSNAWDGFIIYQIPVDVQPEDVIVHGRFDGFGSAYWYLKEKS